MKKKLEQKKINAIIDLTKNFLSTIWLNMDNKIRIVHIVIKTSFILTSYYEVHEPN